MKPIHTLTWAVSAPILLFAGASQATDISTLTAPSCAGGFVLDSGGYIKCAAFATAAPICTPSITPSTGLIAGNTATISANCPSATSWAWTPDIGNVSTKSILLTAGPQTYSVIGSNSQGPGESSSVQFTVGDASANPPPSGGACPSTYQAPAGTTIIRMGGKDNLSNREFNQAFDAPGNKIDSRSEAGQIKAWEFDNNAFLSGMISGAGGNYGSNYKDWSISACPGDFSSALGAKCLKTKRSEVSIYYHASDATQGCVVPPNQTMYLNIRANDPTLSAGYVVSNIPAASLP